MTVSSRTGDVLVAVGLTLVATAGQLGLTSLIGPLAPFLLYWPAIVAAAYFRGRRAAILTVALSVVVSDYYFVPPFRMFPLTVSGGFAVAAFAVTGTAVAYMGGELHAARNEARARARAFRATLDAFTSPFFTLTPDWRFSFVNRRRAEIGGRTADDLRGRVIWDEFPVLIGTEYERRYREVMRTREPVRFEAYGPLTSTWYEVNVFPSAEGGISVFFYDRTTQRRAADALADADRQKDEFLAILSHELRTPLNVISGWTQILQRRRDECPADLRTPIDTIQRNTSLLTRLVNDLVDISRFMQGKFTLASEAVDLGTLARDVASQAEPVLRARRQALRLDVGAGVPPVLGDPQRLTQVLTNLLNNASKFTPEGGGITLAVRGTDTRVEIEVADTGAGIPRELLPFVFDPFRQGDNRPHRGTAGLGLGLAIARRIVEAHGGHISADSAGPGRGARFLVELPAIS